MQSAPLIWHNLSSTLLDILPIVLVLAVFQLLVLRRPIPHLRRTLIGVACVASGLVCFLIGLDMALLPIGRQMAEQLVALGTSGSTTDALPWQHYRWVYLFAFCIGAAAVMVEPAVISVAIKANQLSGGSISINGLRGAIAVGVGLGIALGCFRIVTGGPLYLYILGAYLLVLLQTLVAPRRMVPLAYDSGGVSTSTVTVPIVAALGLGLASQIPGRNVLIDGFGMIAFAVVFPVITVLAYAQIQQWLALHIDRRQDGSS